MLGDKVRAVAEQQLTAGDYDYTVNGDNLAPGVYVCRLIVTAGKESRMIVRRLVKEN